MKTLFINISFLTALLVFQSCGEDAVITNDAVEILELKYNLDRDYCIVTYSLDVGARGTRLYKSLLKTKELDGDLLKGHLPTGVSNVQWVDSRTVSILYNSWLEHWNATGNRNLIPLFEKMDTVSVGDIKFIVSARKDTY